jgi:hypothetical protein
MVHKSASIDVVLWRDAGRPDCYESERKRYRQFFPKHRLSFEPKGVEKFVDDHILE